MVVHEMWFIPVLSLSAIFGIALSSNVYKGFDDSILFKINWPGRNANDLGLLDNHEGETLLITTLNNEQYKCLLPHFQEKEKDSTELYHGPSPYDLISPLFQQLSCSYRLETYWTYEVCHGQYVRQYHEEREGKKVKLQEYFLGKWNKNLAVKLRAALKVEQVNQKYILKSEAPVKKIDGLNMPYLQLNMTDGTLCDLNQKPRQTKVIYVCYPHGKHEVYSLKETSTCEYEVIILSPLLCSHPRYKPQESGDNVINCHPLEGTPKKPKSLLAIEAESLKLRQIKPDETVQKVFAVFSVDKSGEGQDGETRVKVELHTVDPTENIEPTEADQPSGIISENPMAMNFLTGQSCLHGGSGWWKYEFCYGKTVDQYHIEKHAKRTVVHLGKFIFENHIAWLEQNPHKRPKPLAQRKSISHFYSMGSMCDKTGRPRQTEVKLKCSDNASPTQVGLYLLEPRTCEYILGIESPLICKILHQADSNGLTDNLRELVDEMTVSEDGYEVDEGELEEEGEEEDGEQSYVVSGYVQDGFEEGTYGEGEFEEEEEEGVEEEYLESGYEKGGYKKDGYGEVRYHEKGYEAYEEDDLNETIPNEDE